jgi:EAL domain-containing protein (putative c-di-GMP-specific phosphodiesterase class I)
MEHSNMDRIRDIPADFVKIDRSFIVQMEGNPRSLAIIKALVSMSKELDFQIIAEGIETLAQARLLEEAGVTRVQGYYYGRPQSVDYWLDQLDKGLL